MKFMLGFFMVLSLATHLCGCRTTNTKNTNTAREALNPPPQVIDGFPARDTPAQKKRNPIQAAFNTFRM